MKTALIWFKTDLRLHDNETLSRAIAENDLVVPLYCLDNAHFCSTDFGYKKTGSFRAQFLLQSLSDLDRNLRKKGSGLLLLKGNPAEQIAAAAKQFGAQRVYSMQEEAWEELQTQSAVETALRKDSCELLTFNTATLYQEQDLPFTVDSMPDVFTIFRKRVESESTIGKCNEAPDFIHSPKLEALVLPSLTELELEPAEIDARAAIKFQGGETVGFQRLEHYLFGSGAISTYKETRNGMCGEDYSSKFSAWLAMGCLSARQIFSRLKNYEADCGANESTYWLFFELLWREYFRWMMRKYKQRLFFLHGIKGRGNVASSRDSQKLQNWQNGRTGNDFVDANMRELKLTGFMSNRGRQNVASYLCNDLQLDWRYGAAYFEQQLIDYDVSSNWGNWAYIAGVGNDPRGKRIFNTEKQAADYDKDRRFRKLWLS